MPSEDLPGGTVIGFAPIRGLLTPTTQECTDCTNHFNLKTRHLPMIEQKKTAELIETSLICLLSAGVAIGAFLLMWLLAVLTGVS